MPRSYAPLAAVSMLGVDHTSDAAHAMVVGKHLKPRLLEWETCVKIAGGMVQRIGGSCGARNSHCSTFGTCDTMHIVLTGT